MAYRESDTEPLNGRVKTFETSVNGLTMSLKLQHVGRDIFVTDLMLCCNNEAAITVYLEKSGIGMQLVDNKFLKVTFSDNKKKSVIIFPKSKGLEITQLDASKPKLINYYGSKVTAMVALKELFKVEN